VDSRDSVGSFKGGLKGPIQVCTVTQCTNGTGPFG
jgi:hypothetical protein